jgi:tubulin polyglutamylase TTLL2
MPFIDGESTYWNLSWKGNNIAKAKKVIGMISFLYIFLKGGRYRLSDYENVQSFQRLNHFPNTTLITRKDTLFRLLKKLRLIYGSIYDFFPLTISLPKDYIKFVRVYVEEEEKGSKATWICKPVDSSRGRGISVFRSISDLSYDCRWVIFCCNFYANRLGKA